MPFVTAARPIVSAAFILAGTIATAFAADPVFPTNSRVGIVPPPGFTASQRFMGFENPQASAAILMITMPAEAYADVEKTLADDKLKTSGITVAKRENVPLKDGSGVYVAGTREQEGAKRYEAVMVAKTRDVTALISVQMIEASHATLTDAIVIDALKTLAVRQVPDAEKLSILPYKVTQLSGFRVVRTAGDGSAILTLGPKEVAPLAEQPLVIVGIAGGQEVKAEDREKFARQFITSAPGVKDIKITRAEPMRIAQMAGHEIVAEGKETTGDTDVTLVQWIRFGQTGQMQMLSIVKRSAWNETFPKLRAIRDGIELTR
jgi:hypothetical protein